MGRGMNLGIRQIKGLVRNVNHCRKKSHNCVLLTPFAVNDIIVGCVMRFD